MKIKRRLCKVVSFVLILCLMFEYVPNELSRVYADANKNMASNGDWEYLGTDSSFVNGITATVERAQFYDGEDGSYAVGKKVMMWPIYGASYVYSKVGDVETTTSGNIARLYIMPYYYDSTGGSGKTVQVGTSSSEDFLLLIHVDENNNYWFGTTMSSAKLRETFVGKDFVTFNLSGKDNVATHAEFRFSGANNESLPLAITSDYIPGEVQKKVLNVNTVFERLCKNEYLDVAKARNSDSYVYVPWNGAYMFDMRKGCSEEYARNILEFLFTISNLNITCVSDIPDNIQNPLSVYDVVKDRSSFTRKDEEGNDVAADISEIENIYLKVGDNYIENESGLAKYLQSCNFNMSSAKLDSSKYPKMSIVEKTLMESVYKIYKELQEGAVEEVKETVSDERAISTLQEALESDTSVALWFFLINNFFVTGETTYEPEEGLGITDTTGAPLDLLNYGVSWVDPNDKPSSYRDDMWEGRYDGNEVFGVTRWSSAHGAIPYVSAEEDIRIRIYYSIMRNYLKVSDSSIAAEINDICEERLDNVFDMKYVVNSKEFSADRPTDVGEPETHAVKDHDSVNVPTTAQSEATSASDKFKKEQDRPSIKTTANNFEALMKYLFYGVITPNAEYVEEGGGTTNVVKLNKNLTAIIPEFVMSNGDADALGDEQSVSSEILSFSSLGLPTLPQAKEIGNSYQSLQMYGQLQLALMYIKRWAAVKTDVGAGRSISTTTGDGENEGDEEEETSESGITARVYKAGATGTYSGLKVVGEDIIADEATKDDFTNPIIDEFLVKIEGEDDEAKRKPDSDAASYIQYYIQIYNGLTYIGCKPGTAMYDSWIGPELQKIMDYYDKIKEFENVVSAQVNDPQSGDEQSFAMIFNDDEKSFMAHYAEGVAASATYVPLITNLYDPEAWSIIPEESFIDEFHYKYGFLRKALYRDTTANAAMNYYVTGNIGKLTPVTLRDFLENDGSDLVLYIDPKMYRVDKISEKFNLAYARLQNTEEADNMEDGAIESIAHAVSTWMETDAESICKTGTAKVYSQDMANKTDAKGVRNPGWRWDDRNHYIMTDNDIEYYLYKDGSDEDSIQKAFAVVSGIYRDKSVFNIAQNESANPSPVFISSKSLCNMVNATNEEFNTLYNYMMVINLKHKQGMDYDVDLDMDSPLFMDVYGNICSMSGIVIIPSVSNATLYNSTNYDAANAGVASLYNDLEAEKIKSSWLKNSQYLDDAFGEGDDGYIEMQNKQYQSGESGPVDIVFANLALSSTNVKEKMYEVAYANAMATGSQSSGIAGSKFNSRVNLILEVLRGADIEDIDLMKEGLSGITNMDKTGIYIAYRVEQLGGLIMSNSNGNNLLELPNLAFMPGLEYIVVVLFKVLFAVMIVILMIQIYLDGVADKLGWRTVASFMITIASIIIAVIALPSLINFSYYNINKLLLQDECTYMQMLNLEKSMNGQEISIRQSSNGKPQTSTKFYLKLDQVKVPWWSVITDVLASDTFVKMEDVYENAMDSSIYSQFGDGDPDAIVKHGNSLYASVDWLFNTSRVEFASYSEMDNAGDLAEDKTAGYLYQNVTDMPKMSYLLPYYTIMDNLLLSVVEYNQINNVAGYTSIPTGNDNEQILTRGLLKPYFTSFDFMQSGCDLLGLYKVYGIDPPKDTGTIFTEDEIARMRRSLWCNYEGLTTNQIRAGLEELDLEAKRFIVENRGMLDKVSDATFIKCMALYLATRHNSIMKVPACRGLEVYAMDTRDIMRLSLASKNTVMKGSQKSFEKFCYDIGGTFAIILAGFLEVIYWITSLIKPVVMIILMFALVFSYIYRKLIRQEGNSSVQGYLVSVALICLINIIYAVFIKFSMWIPNYTNNVIMCLLMQLILQIGYALLLLAIASIILRNIHDIGYYTYKSIYNTHMAQKVNSIQMSAQRLMTNSIFSHSKVRRPYNSNSYRLTRDMTGENILDSMHEREERRKDNVYNNR